MIRDLGVVDIRPPTLAVPEPSGPHAARETVALPGPLRAPVWLSGCLPPVFSGHALEWESGWLYRATDGLLSDVVIIRLERVQKALVNRTGTNFQARGTFSPEKCATTGPEPLAFGARAASSPPSRVPGS